MQIPARSVLLLWMFAFCAVAETLPRLEGVVRDPSGAGIEGAAVEIRSAGGTLLSTQRTDAEGRFYWNAPRPGHIRLRVEATGLAAGERVAYLDERAGPLSITLEPAAVETRITVNATRGSADELSNSPHVAFIKERDEILRRPVVTIGNALEESPGTFVQQSTYGQVSPFLRGLTGYHVLNLVDGIRFNNSTFRSGPNQYLAFLEPGQAQRVEALLGPTGSQYGSDSLGGTIQVITPEPRFTDSDEGSLHGDFSLGGASADLSGSASGRLSLSNQRWSLLLGASGRRHNDLRAGGGYDSRNVFHRLFGMPLDDVRNLTGPRAQDSGFRQYGVQSKLGVRLTPSHLLTLSMQRAVQDDVRGYKDLLGGLGRVLSVFDPQILNWFYGRYEKLGLGFADSLTATFSVNSQTDGSARQNLRYSDPITRDHNRVNAYGYTVQAATHRGSRLLASFGGDIYDEHVASAREVANPATGIVTRPRPLYPDDSRYTNLGVFAQAAYDLTGTVRASGGARLTSVRFQTREDAAYGVPESSQWFRDITFHATLGWQAARPLGFHAVVSRGFRAPNLNDLGALGLNDLGYEIPSAEAIPAGALLSTSEGEAALSKNMAVRALKAESLMNYEAGVRVSVRQFYARMQVFDAELYDPVVRRTLLFPATNVPSQLSGLPVRPIPQTAAQREQGVVTVATQFDPRAVKAFVNDGRARYNGFSGILQYRAGRWTAEGNYSYILGRELNPNRNVRRLPPATGMATLRYSLPGRRPWIEASMAFAGEQTRLSGGDRDDERIGASFRRRDIADFFQSARVAPFLRDGVFTPTGETLAQIQDRVLPLGAVVNGVQIADDSSRAPLYLSTGSWQVLSIRTGIPLGERWQAMAAIENLLDRNYRYHGSGVDAPGISAYLGVRYVF